jgi:hypothetical protein
MKTEAEVEDFTDELSDEALDRAEGGGLFVTIDPAVIILKISRPVSTLD